MQATGQQAFEAMADPTRRQILQFLTEHTEVSVGEIVQQFTLIGRTAVSSHLRVLRIAGLVVERRDGRFRRYSLSPEGPIHDAVAFLQDIVQAALPTERVVMATFEPADEDSRSAKGA